MRTLAVALWVPLLAALPGCPHPDPSPDPAHPASAPEPASAPASIPACGPADQRFATLGWMPADARAAAVVRLDDPQLADALALVGAGARDAERQLPIRVAFSVGQWTWQVPLLRSTLAQAGFAPRQLAYVALPDGTTIWAWPSGCDLETTTENLRAAWGLELRTTPYGAVAVAPRRPDGGPTFAYDFVIWGASFAALVPAGRAGSVTQQLADRGGDPLRERLGSALERLQPAPIRMAIRMDALLAGSDPALGIPVTAHRVDATGWVVSDPVAPLQP